ncbi:MAG: hypothetical protein FJW27_17795 [Acidimicrobiia bacterium]|nr:hypothetical protein [Acidimicrobiia bacterium]
MKRTGRLQSLQDGSSRFQEVLLVRVAVEECRAELGKERLTQRSEVRSEVRRREAQESMHRAGDIHESATQRALRVERQPGTHDQRARAVAGDIHAFVA